jgi:diguanylate cyclase (GGDEF)-like protein
MRLLDRRTMRWWRRRGVPLWSYLTALVLVPLLGVVVLTTLVARDRQADADSAARAEEAVRAVARLDAARSGVEHEIVPMLSLAALHDEDLADSLGLPDFLVAGQMQIAVQTAAEARAATDAALGAVPAGSLGSEAARQAAADLAELRERADAPHLVTEDFYFDYLAVSNALMGAQRRAAAVASAEEVPAATQRAIRDVDIAAHLAQAASRQTPLFLASQLQAGELTAGARLGGENARLAYTDAQRAMEDLSQPALSLRWAEVRSAPAVVEVDALLSPGAGPDGRAAVVAIDELVPLLFRANERDALLAGLVVSAVEEVQGLAAADRVEARERLATTLQLGLGLLLVSAVGALVLGRRVARSLGALARQATEISEGRLQEVEASGPREVRTVSTALGSAVATLRRIQDQAQAVARGDLSDPLLDEPLPGPLGAVVHASVQEVVHAVRQRQELQSALTHEATHDPLTGLPNRAQALALITSALHRGRRSGQMTGLLFVDLDGFKAVNDAHGHACGDEVLRTVAGRMSAAVRPGDVVCRLGGDEFVVLVEAVPDEHDLQQLGDRLIAAVSETVDFDGQHVAVGASIGIATSRDAGTDADVLLAEADTAAYRAKRRGRGRTEMFDEALRLQLQERAELEAAIGAGLAAGEMHLHYQPVIDVAEHRVTGYEALLRWERPGVGPVRPDDFIPVAEGSALICDIGRWVLHTATRQLAAWLADLPEGAPQPTVAVNISGRHLADRSVVSDVADALAASGLPARCLVLEITETVMVSDPLAIGHLEALREMGVSVAIDDFGTGYTSIGQLQHMPVDTLKIDRSFVASDDAGTRALVALMIRAAHTFGLTVVAEGVEQPEQLERLRAESCDHAQGYLLHRPLPPAVASRLLPLRSPTGR